MSYPGCQYTPPHLPAVCTSAVVVCALIDVSGGPEMCSPQLGCAYVSGSPETCAQCGDIDVTVKPGDCTFENGCAYTPRTADSPPMCEPACMPPTCVDMCAQIDVSSSQENCTQSSACAIVPPSLVGSCASVVGDCTAVNVQDGQGSCTASHGCTFVPGSPISCLDCDFIDVTFGQGGCTVDAGCRYSPPGNGLPALCSSDCRQNTCVDACSSVNITAGPQDCPSGCFYVPGSPLQADSPSQPASAETPAPTTNPTPLPTLSPTIISGNSGLSKHRIAQAVQHARFQRTPGSYLHQPKGTSLAMTPDKAFSCMVDVHLTSFVQTKEGWPPTQSLQLFSSPSGTPLPVYNLASPVHIMFPYPHQTAQHRFLCHSRSEGEISWARPDDLFLLPFSQSQETDQYTSCRTNHI